MEEKEITIRLAKASDAQALLEIYAPYVEHTAITFEYEVPSRGEFEKRIKEISARYPYLVAEKDGKIVGYSYAHPFGERAAYARSAETALYVDRKYRGCGIGTLLSSRLERILKRQNVLNLYACIATTEGPDPYLTGASPAFHAARGYRKIGYFTKCGYKFGRWYDMIWMEKFIGEHGENPAPFLRIDEIEKIL